MSKQYQVPVGERCQVKGCKSEYSYIYLKKRICEWHWDKLANNSTALRKALNLSKDK